MKHYVVSGGAGFLGSNLVLRLIEEGNKVTVLDDLSCGKKRNLKEVLDSKNFKFIKHNIQKPFSIRGKVDYVLNMACPASPPMYFNMMQHTMETCSMGARNMLELARKKGARFFHTSTSEVYGDPLEHPQKETYFGNVDPYCKRSCYDEAKRYVEALIYIYRHEYGVDTSLIRIFNTYGPRMRIDDGRVITNFIAQTKAGKNITLHGTGKQTRSFCFVDDQVEGILKMIESGEEGPINIGNPNEFTIKELANILIDLTGSKSKIKHTKGYPSDPKKRKPNITKAKKLLGWSPKVQLKEGLKKTIAWFDEIGYEPLK